MNENILVTCISAPNIALIKYWGKENEELILPLNGSISITLDRNVLCSKTSLLLVRSESSNKKIQITLNSVTQEIADDPNDTAKRENDLISRKRLFKILTRVRENCSLENPHCYEIRISSANNFPTASGLASSASGFACLAQCLSVAFKYKGDLTELTRLGSGSACRSCFGGFVKWSSAKESNVSLATQLFPAQHWPELNILAIVLEDEKKKVSSTDGMQTTVQTSDLLKWRVQLVENERLKEMQLALSEKNFNKVGKLAIRDSNCFHAVCMDTYPPLFYMNEKSKEIIHLVNEYNKFEQNDKEDLKAFYSFDAGPNAFLFVRDEHLNELVYLIYSLYFGSLEESDFYKLKLVKDESANSIKQIGYERKKALQDHFYKLNGFSRLTSFGLFIKYIIHSKVGQDPAVYENDWSVSSFNKEDFEL